MSPALPPAIRRYAEHPFWQAVGIMLLAYILVVWVVPLLPGSAIVPKSVVLQYMITVLVGVLIYVSDNEERWRRFKEPIQAVLVEPRLKAVRAVAHACASNMIAVAIPCHRVVRNDGALAGYRWGVQRKRSLLEREAAL